MLKHSLTASRRLRHGVSRKSRITGGDLNLTGNDWEIGDLQVTYPASFWTASWSLLATVRTSEMETSESESAPRPAAVHELDAAQAASRQRLDALFQSLLHRAFNGEL